MVKIIALVLPLALDTFAVSTALGLWGVSTRQRMRASLLFTAFEALMPLVGLLIGRALGNAIGSTADYAAIAVLVVLAVHMLIFDKDERELGSLLDSGVRASVALGLSTSLDELGIGFTLGLLRLPVLPVLALIAVQTFVVAQLGMRVGARVEERVREGAERLAAAALLLFAIGLLVAKLVR